MNTETNMNEIVGNAVDAGVRMAMPVSIHRQIPVALWQVIVGAIDPEKPGLISHDENHFSVELPDGSGVTVMYIACINKAWVSVSEPEHAEVFDICENLSVDAEGMRKLLLAAGQESAALRIRLFQSREKNSLYDRQAKAVAKANGVQYDRESGNYSPFIPRTPEEIRKARNRKILKYTAVGTAAVAVLGLGAAAVYALCNSDSPIDLGGDIS